MYEHKGGGEGLVIVVEEGREGLAPEGGRRRKREEEEEEEGDGRKRKRREFV